MARRLNAQAATHSQSPQNHRHHGTVEIPARHRVEPYQQGQLDRMCGLYAVINAMRLALADVRPLSMAEARQLMERGVKLMARRDALKAACVSGMDVPMLEALARCCIRWLCKHGRDIAIERPGKVATGSMAAASRWIEESLAAGQPVIATFEGGLDHFSVIAAATETRFYLFDSCGIGFVRRINCAFSGTYHTIPPDGLFRIVHRPKG